MGLNRNDKGKKAKISKGVHRKDIMKLKLKLKKKIFYERSFLDKIILKLVSMVVQRKD